MQKSWVPPTANDVLKPAIEVLSREVDDKNFLRPAKDSPLATGGAGGDLPPYVGAVPPQGAPAWDWQRTWELRSPLTVSQNAKDGGRFRTIGEALQAARPGMTIRILDNATYRENLSLTRSSAHSNITIESPLHALLVSNVTRTAAVQIESVGGVVVRGLKLRADAERIPLILVNGRCPGTVLENLDFLPGKPDSSAIELNGVKLSADDPPVIIRDNTIRQGMIGVGVGGLGADYKTANPSSRILVQNNLILDAKLGVVIQGEVDQVRVVGNRIGGAQFSAIGADNILSGTRNVLVANNTLFENTTAFRLWSETVQGNIVVRNNLTLNSKAPDMIFVDSGGNQTQPRGPGDGNLVLKAWTFNHNWREGATPTGEGIFERSWIPPAKDDVLQARIEVLSRDQNAADFLRPAKDSPLATGGAGGDLPSYVGAVPPEGETPWDWDKTWKP